MSNNNNSNNTPLTLPATVEGAEALLEAMIDDLSNIEKMKNSGGWPILVMDWQNKMGIAARALRNKSNSHNVEESIKILQNEPLRPARDNDGNLWLSTENKTLLTSSGSTQHMRWEAPIEGNQPKNLVWLIDDEDFRIDNIL